MPVVQGGRIADRGKKVKPDLLKQWIEALRSGKYRQCFETLTRVGPQGRAYCCLGVLARVAGYNDEDLENKATLYARPTTLQDFDVLGVELLDPDTELTLTEMNDRGYDFSEIADFLENQARTLFRTGGKK